MTRAEPEAPISRWSHDTGVLRSRGQAKASREMLLGGTIFSPHLTLGIVMDKHLGGHAAASLASGEELDIGLDDSRDMRAVAGLGFDMKLSNGVVVEVSYEGEVSRTATAHALMGGVKFIW